MMYAFIMQDQFDRGIAEGIAKGKAEGIAEGLSRARAEKAQTVKAMHENHIPFEMIAKCTFLTEDEVRSILSEK